MDFGLQNYGPGPALYLQVEVVTGSSDEPLLQIKPRERPLHLEEDGFLGLLHDDRVPDDEFGQRVADDEVGDETVYLYYSYVSRSGARTPEPVRGDAKRDDETLFEELKEECPDPRQMELERIREHCSEKEARQSKESSKSPTGTDRYL